MAYEHYDINDLRGSVPRPGRFARLLHSLFGYNGGKAAYGLCIDIAAFVKRIGIFLALPFKFIQFTVEEYKKTKNQDPK